MVWVVAGLGLLYAWLMGWWFARLLVFLGLTVAIDMLLRFDLGQSVGLVLGLIIAWPVASLPTYWRRFITRRAIHIWSPSKPQWERHFTG